MARHRSTMSNWSNDGTTWVWFEGTNTELEAMKAEALERWKDDIECGLAEPTGDTDYFTSFANRPHYMAFVFKKTSDAVLFKLTY